MTKVSVLTVDLSVVSDRHDRVSLPLTRCMCQILKDHQCKFLINFSSTVINIVSTVFGSIDFINKGVIGFILLVITL